MPTGGRLFELYLDMMGSRTSHEAYRSFLHNNKDDEDAYMPADEMQAILERDKGSFHGFIMISVGNISTKVRRQRFYLSFVGKFHGLSRKGLQLLSYFGILIKPTVYDAMLKDMLKEQQQACRYQIQHKDAFWYLSFFYHDNSNPT